MLRFFRLIRRKLIEEENMRKYIWYAIGEILLVVFGILIALQINNWNEARKSEIETELIKENLKEEFRQNRNVLEDRINLLDSSLNNARQLLDLFGRDISAYSSESLDTLLVYSLYYGNFNPPNNTINEIFQSGKSNLIEDRVLKNQLSEWLQLLEDTDEDFKNQDQLANMYLQPYLRDHISTRNIDVAGYFNITNEQSILLENYYEDVLNDVKFENLLVDQSVWNTIMVEHYKELDSLAIEIINQIVENE